MSKAWRDDLGADFQNIQQTWLHTLGNLTLTGYNAEYGDRSFPEKRDMEGGFKQSPLKLNEGLASAGIWKKGQNIWQIGRWRSGHPLKLRTIDSKRIKLNRQKAICIPAICIPLRIV